MSHWQNGGRRRCVSQNGVCGMLYVAARGPWDAVCRRMGVLGGVCREMWVSRQGLRVERRTAHDGFIYVCRKIPVLRAQRHRSNPRVARECFAS